MNRDLLGKPTIGSAVARQVPGRAEQCVLPAGTSISCTPVPTRVSRNSHVTVTLDGTSSARHLLQQHAGSYESSLLRRQLNRSSAGTAVTPAAAPPKAQPFLPEQSLLAQHLTQRTNEPKGIALTTSDKVRILKTSGGTVTVRSLSPVVTTCNNRVQMEQPRVTYSSVLTEQSRVARTVNHSFPAAVVQKRVPPPLIAAAPNTPRKILPKPIHNLTFMANGGRQLPNAAALSARDVASRMKYTEVVSTHPTSGDVTTGLKNMAVVHPQVRPAMSSNPVAATELAKDMQLSKASIQTIAVSVAQKLVQSDSTSTTSASRQQSLPGPNQVVPVSIQRSIPPTVAQRMDDEESRKSRMIFVELSEAAEMAALAKQSASVVNASSESRVPTPPAANEEPLPLEAGCLQVPSGLKVDFINLDDLLIGDLNYLAKYFGLSILEPLSMDDIANKGLSEWIDISDEAEVEKTFVELKELSGRSPGQQLCWTNQLTPDSPDIAYPIVVPEYEELETTFLSPDTAKPSFTVDVAEGKSSSSSSSSSSPVTTASHSPRNSRECSTTKSPLILIIKKGANSSASSPAWQLSPRRQSASKDSEESKALFFAALNLLPSAGEQLRKLRKGKSARALAVLKDKVMSEYLKNHYVPLHRVQGMYRYLFKKGHLREGKLTYACEVYRNLRSRENRPRASLVISRYDDEDFTPKKNQSASPGLLWHLKKKKTSSKYEIDEDYVPRKSQTNGQKIRRSLWGRPKGSWRAAAIATETRSGRSSRSSSVSVETSSAGGYGPTPLYRLEAGNWTPKCAADEDSGRWDIWVSENSLESKMSRPIPMVVLTRIEDCQSEASSEVEPPQHTQVSELFCSCCSYSCLFKPSLVEHFSSQHEGTVVSFKAVIISCRGNKTALSTKSQGPAT